jgi:hypothetical protein
MSSCGVFEGKFIKGKKFTHPVNGIQELNENIIGIDFIHAHKPMTSFHVRLNLPEPEQIQ